MASSILKLTELFNCVTFHRLNFRTKELVTSISPISQLNKNVNL